MARVRYNFQAGTITNNPLASGGTSVTSAEFAALPAVAGPDTLILILDPAGVDGAPEIVTVTAHTGSSTTATVTRASESSTARAHASGTQWIHGVTAADIVNLTTSTPAASAVGDAAVAGSAATSSPSDHKHAREGFSATTPVQVDAGDAGTVGSSASPARSDHEHPVGITSAQLVSTGAWTSYAPSNTNVTVGNGTQTARYLQMGKTVFVSYSLTFGSTTSFSGTVAIGLPVACFSAADLVACGSAALFDADSSVDYSAVMWLVDSTHVRFQTHAGSSSGSVSSSAPFTFTTADVVTFTAVYEEA